jgi:hypothetical protein
MSSSDKNVDYGVTADPSPFVQAMQRAADSATGSAEKIKSTFDQVEKTFEEVQKKLLLITAVVQGGKFFKDAIGEATKLTGEATHLARRLGITGEQASALNTALGDIYSDSETYIGAFDKFAKPVTPTAICVTAKSCSWRPCSSLAPTSPAWIRRRPRRSSSARASTTS